MPETNKATPSGSTKCLHAGKLLPAAHIRTEYVAEVAYGTTLEDVIRPEFWRHHAAAIMPNSIIEVVCEDGSWEASLRVMFITEIGVETAVRWSAKHDVSTPKDTPGKHEIRWISPSKRFGIVHRETGKVVKDGLYPRQNAQRVLAQL